jgi:hypothetical protein
MTAKWATGTKAVSPNPGTKCFPPTTTRFIPMKQNPIKLYKFMNASTPVALTDGDINVLLQSSPSQLTLSLFPVKLNKAFLYLTN